MNLHVVSWGNRSPERKWPHSDHPKWLPNPPPIALSASPLPTFQNSAFPSTGQESSGGCKMKALTSNCLFFLHLSVSLLNLEVVPCPCFFNRCFSRARLLSLYAFWTWGVFRPFSKPEDPLHQASGMEFVQTLLGYIFPWGTHHLCWWATGQLWLLGNSSAFFPTPPSNSLVLSGRWLGVCNSKLEGVPTLGKFTLDSVRP